jgi:hypothetical protein
MPLPVEAHEDFPLLDRHRRVLLGVSDGRGRSLWGGVVDLGPARLVPGRSIGRMLRASCAVDPRVRDTIVELLIDLAKAESALRIQLELSDPDTAARRAFTEHVCARGFRVVAEPRQYSRTILIDLRRSEGELLAGFHPTCRRNIRAFAKHPLRCEPLSGQELAVRLAALDVETMQRTGGVVEALSWPDILRFVRDHPTQAALFGVMRTDRQTDDALVGYVFGVRHGDTVEYRRAASTRLRDLRAPLLYMPTWRLFQWGQSHGARCFDFGGIGDGSHATGEATGGVSDYKRYFRDESIDIGAEVDYSPVPLVDGLMRSVAKGRSGLLTFFRRR